MHFELTNPEYIYVAEILFLAEWWSGSEVRLYTDPEDRKLWGKEHSLIIMNHTYEVDWLMGWMVADSCGILGVSQLRNSPIILISALKISVCLELSYHDFH